MSAAHPSLMGATTQRRQPQGQPAGGQFASKTQSIDDLDVLVSYGWWGIAPPSLEDKFSPGFCEWVGEVVDSEHPGAVAVSLGGTGRFKDGTARIHTVSVRLAFQAYDRQNRPLIDSVAMRDELGSEARQFMTATDIDVLASAVIEETSAMSRDERKDAGNDFTIDEHLYRLPGSPPALSVPWPGDVDDPEPPF